MKLDRVFMAFVCLSVPVALFFVSRPAAWTAALVGVIALAWGMSILDPWQRVYAVMLVLFVCSMSSFHTAVDVAYVARYVAVAVLVLVTWATPAPTHAVREPKVARCLWLVAVVAFASVVWSVDQRTTLLQALILALLAALVYGLMTRRWAVRPELIQGDLGVGAWVLVAVFAAGIVASQLGLVGTLAQQNDYTTDPYSTDRFRGLFENANALGYLAALTLLILVGLWRGSGRKIHLLGMVPTGASLVMCESRTALVAVVIGAVLIVLRGRANRARVLALVLASGIGVAVANAAGWIHLSTVGHSLDERFTTNGGNDLLTGRGVAWSTAIDQWQHNPITGYGFSAGPSIFKSLEGNGQLRFDAYVVHNSYLQWLLETGLIGAVPLLLLLSACIAIVLRGSLAGIGLGLVPAVLAGLFIQVTESAMFGGGQVYPYLFWLVVAAASMNKSPQPPRPDSDATHGNAVGHASSVM